MHTDDGYGGEDDMVQINTFMPSAKEAKVPKEKEKKEESKKVGRKPAAATVAEKIAP